MDAELFRETAERINSLSYEQNGIGTLGECTLHRTLKYYFEPDDRFHEQKAGRYVADILNYRGITEIQTRSVYKIKGKLSTLLEKHNVMLVYPVAQTKWLIWVDAATGEVTRRRKSPKTGRCYDALSELSSIKELFFKPGFSVCICLLEIEEYRWLNGWSRNKKKGSSRMNRVPIDMNGQLLLEKPDDFKYFVPESLPEQFSSRDYKTISHLSLKKAQNAVKFLYDLGVINRVSKLGNAHIYERV